MKKILKLLPIICAGIIFASILTIQSCKKEANTKSNSTTESSTVRVHLTDAPGDFDEVNVDVLSVHIHSDVSGWDTIKSINAGVYNLLDFTNGLDTLLGSTVLPAGKISQMRLVLGTRNTVNIDGTISDLKTPSAQQSGLKFKIDATLKAGITYDVWIDFDAKKSVVETGGGKFILKPTIRTFTNATSGGIEGYALPTAAKSEIHAINGLDTFSTNADTTTGYFLIRGVPANLYNVLFDNSSSYRDSTVNGINVITGSVTDMDTITMQP